jgi:hypothetical protein
MDVPVRFGRVLFWSKHDKCAIFAPKTRFLLLFMKKLRETLLRVGKVEI